MVSVIISVYNMAPYIERCVASIQHQTYSDLEIITVNDGSTDDSGAICERLAQADERIVVIHKENGGNASARNAGINAATGDFLSFIDADDYIENNMYEEMLAETKDADVSMVCCGMVVKGIDGHDSIQVSKERKVFSKEEALYDIFARQGNISMSACNKLFRRNLFDKGLRFNNNVIHEDTEAMPRFLDASERIIVINKAFYNYIKRSNSASTLKRFNLRGYHILDSMKEYEEMCKKKYPAVLPYFCYHEMATTHGMLMNLSSCVDARHYIRQEISLRYRMIKAVFKCMKWEGIRKEYKDQIKLIFIRAVLGVRLTELVGGICSRLKH
ncbi:MAG: glycosyltransferase family 2 protein [Lachnospiraceae bacterium]|nr:glycosyltransferase family 2 protein [Lachnospiraceae bacterium]